MQTGSTGLSQSGVALSPVVSAECIVDLYASKVVSISIKIKQPFPSVKKRDDWSFCLPWHVNCWPFDF